MSTYSNRLLTALQNLLQRNAYICGHLQRMKITCKASDFLSFIDVELIRFFHGALHFRFSKWRPFAIFDCHIFMIVDKNSNQNLSLSTCKIWWKLDDPWLNYCASWIFYDVITDHPVGFLPTGLRRRVAATSPLRQPTTTGRAALQAQHLRPKGICRGRSVCVELSAWQFERSGCWQW